MKIKLLAIITMVILAVTLLNDNKTFAYPPFLKETKALGFDAKDCTYCHQKNVGGKGWNKRGLWLKDQKKERKAPVVDVKWLKFYSDDSSKEEVKNNKASDSPSN
ncbi:MAG: hypothetical protein IPK14_10095 [Blastocatellia bacterium]|nr:hypothetical protein [Blastocatellia bacterium]MBN8724645.1 hypothetical protein [Acidobacteriota bacterium]